MEPDHDIFISYSHLDNEAPFPDDPGWISFFHQVLEKRVSQLAGRRLKVWRDPELRGNDVFPETLGEKIKRSAALICVLSPRYAESDWCNRELREFATSAGDVVVDGAGKARVFKVVKTPLPQEKMPTPVQSLLGYEFFRVDPETQRVRELDVAIDPELKRDYWSRLDDLANDLSQLIETLHAHNGPPVSSKGTADTDLVEGGDATIYLAETTLDQQEARDGLKRELQRHGYTVLPDQPLPLDAPTLKEFIREQLGRSQLAIHLVGASFGIVPEGSSSSVIGLQNDVAAECAAAGGPRRLVWMPPGLEPSDERQTEFIDALRDDERTYERSDLLEVSLEDLKTHVHSTLGDIAREAPEPDSDAGTDDGMRQVYLICDQRDLDAVAPIEDHLFEQGFEVVLSAFEGDEAAIQQDHAANLTTSDAFLFFYGAGDRQWIRNQLRELQKSRGYEGKKQELAAAVYVAKPTNPVKDRFRTHLAEFVVKEEEGFEAGGLAEFVDRIKHG